MGNLSSIFSRLSTNALEQEGLDDYYVDVSRGRGERGYNPIDVLKLRLDNNPGGKLQILFSGYRGCGKSTELNKLQQKISADFFVLNFSVLEDLDLVNINYVELFVIIMEKLFNLVAEHHIRVKPSLFASIREWSRTAEIQKITELTGGSLLEAGMEAKVSALGFAGLFGKIRASANASNTTKKTIIENIEPRLSDLVNHCNALIREVKINLPDIGKKGLLIIVEDLDKLSMDKAEELFFNHSHILRSLHTHVLFTFPISLCYHPKATVITRNFDKSFELPMVKVHDKQGRPYAAGREALRQIIARRIGRECFEPPELVDKFIDASGGCLRDLFSMIIDAAETALSDERELMLEDDFARSFTIIRRDYENTIAEKRIDNVVVTPVAEYYNALKEVALSETKKVDNTGVILDLRHNLCILGYNDEGWCDLHPAVKSILLERKLLS